MPGVISQFVNRVLGNRLPDLISLSDLRVHNVLHAICKVFGAEVKAYLS